MRIQLIESNKVHMAITYLQHLGFHMTNIRLALPKLTGITHAEISIGSGVHVKSVTKYIAGKRKKSDGKIKLARFFNVPVDDLFPDEEQ